MLITNTENIPLHQLLAELLIATNALSLVPQAVKCFFTRRMRVYKKQFVLLPLNLSMPSGDDRIRDDNFVLRITSNTERLFIQNMHPLLTPDIAAHSQ